MNELIGLEVKGIEILKDKITRLPGAIQDAIVPDLAKYVADTMKTYAPQKYVSRATAYGVVSQDGAPPGYFSMKQFRYVMMMMHKGEITIPYKRSQNLARGWKVIGEDRNALVVNEVPYAGFVQGNDTQSRHEGAVGWKTIDATVKAHNAQLIKRGARAANRAAKKLGLNITGNY